MPISIVCIEPEHASNIGAVCRVMKNFGFLKLVLVRPKFKKDDFEAIKYAKHAADVLKNAKVIDQDPVEFIETFDYAVATTAQVGTDYNICRTPMYPEQLANWFSNIGEKPRIGIILGREGHGLFNEEIEKCDMTVTIPSNPKYRTLNISHALSVILYELRKKELTDGISKRFPAIAAKEKDILLEHISGSLDRLDFSTDKKKETQTKVWKRVIGRAGLTKREAFVLMGYFRKVK